MHGLYHPGVNVAKNSSCFLPLKSLKALETGISGSNTYIHTYIKENCFYSN